MYSIRRYPQRVVSFTIALLLLHLLPFRPSFYTAAYALDEKIASSGQHVEISQALFLKLATVLKHPRCSNCHVVGETFTTGDQQKPHKPAKVHGRCDKCHGYRNSPRAPGAVDWRAPPATMGWDRRSPAEICRNLKNPQTNGQRTPQELAYHVTSSPNVLWAWSPGEQLSVPPLSLDEFKTLFARWVETGAHCPGE
jgi:hypothetical protein